MSKWLSERKQQLQAEFSNHLPYVNNQVTLAVPEHQLQVMLYQSTYVWTK
jgi:hypothetical protein